MLIINKLVSFFKSQSVLCIAFIAALVSMLFVPPDGEYIGYFNFSTLILLFCLMGAVCGFRKCGIFTRLSGMLTSKCSSLRGIVFALMNICFFSSMLITNDVALITFVPVTVLIFDSVKLRSRSILAVTVVIEAAAANLGSMMLPTGNPQNIFLCSEYQLSPGFLFRNLLPFGIISYIILTLSVLLIPKQKAEMIPDKSQNGESFSVHTAVLCGGVFAVSLLTVAGIFNEYFCLGVSLVLLTAADFRLFKQIDYALLVTFVCFFVFSGNIGRIESIQSFLQGITADNGVETAIAASQVISNVPAAVLLSVFTDNARELLIGTNIGGLGTPIASLASLIAYRLYMTGKNTATGRFMLIFLAYNAVFLAVMYTAAKIIM